MARALTQLGERIKTCPHCFTYTEREMCDICQDPKHDASLLCVVEEARDISTIESTGAYLGYYHVLGGTLQIRSGHDAGHHPMAPTTRATRDGSDHPARSSLLSPPPLTAKQRSCFSKSLAPLGAP